MSGRPFPGKRGGKVFFGKLWMISRILFRLGFKGCRESHLSLSIDDFCKPQGPCQCKECFDYLDGGSSRALLRQGTFPQQ